jgi:hypothetical protein
MDAGTAECNRTKPSLVVDGGMKLETVVLALPVVTSVGHTSGDPVPSPAHQFADGQHSSVHEAKRCFAFEEAAEQSPQQWIYPVTVSKKVLVIRQVRKVTLVVLEYPVIDLTECPLLHSEGVKDENGNDFTVTENAGASSVTFFSL